MYVPRCSSCCWASVRCEAWEISSAKRSCRQARRAPGTRWMNCTTRCCSGRASRRTCSPRHRGSHSSSSKRFMRLVLRAGVKRHLPVRELLDLVVRFFKWTVGGEGGVGGGGMGWGLSSSTLLTDCAVCQSTFSTSISWPTLFYIRIYTSHTPDVSSSKQIGFVCLQELLDSGLLNAASARLDVLVPLLSSVVVPPNETCAAALKAKLTQVGRALDAFSDILFSRPSVTPVKFCTKLSRDWPAFRLSVWPYRSARVELERV